jgi:hypothetical protein
MGRIAKPKSWDQVFEPRRHDWPPVKVRRVLVPAPECGDVKPDAGAWFPVDEFEHYERVFRREIHPWATSEAHHKGPHATAEALLLASRIADSRECDEALAAVWISAMVFQALGTRGHQLGQEWCGAPYAALRELGRLADERLAQTRVKRTSRHAGLADYVIEPISLDYHRAMTCVVPYNATELMRGIPPQSLDDIVARIQVAATLCTESYRVVHFADETKPNAREGVDYWVTHVKSPAEEIAEAKRELEAEQRAKARGTKR